MARRAGRRQRAGKVTVAKVTAGSPAAAAGLRRGDVDHRRERRRGRQRRRAGGADRRRTSPATGSRCSVSRDGDARTVR